jgi:hypothetical protein
MKAIKTDRGWEIVDKDGILNSEEESTVYVTRKVAQEAIDTAIALALDGTYALGYAYACGYRD